MMKRITTLVAGLALCAGTQSQDDASTEGMTPIDSIVAVVNEDVLLRSELNSSLERVRRQFSGRVNLPPQDVLERQVLERMIITELQLQWAEQNNVRVSENDVDQALEGMAQRNNTTVARLRQSIAADGLEFAEFRESIHDQLVIDQMQERVAQRRVEVSESEVDIQLDKQPAENREYHLATILIGVPDGASPSQVQDARNEAERVHGELRSGRDFAQAAIATSDAQNALQGGDLGWRRAEQIPPQFADQIRNLDPGEVTAPMRAPGGFYILKLLEDRPAQPLMVTEHHARHLLIQSDELLSDQQAYERIVELRQRIVSGEATFEELAREHSDDLVTGSKGGDMGWFTPNEFGTRIAETVAALEEGELSQPFRTAGGWHIMQLLETRQTDRTEDQRRQRAREAIRERKREEEIELWLRQLRAEAYVDVRLSG